MVAGFNSIEEGEISFNSKVINDIPAHKRNIGMVFQNYAIFPHMTVSENVEYGLKLRKLSKEEVKKKLDNILKVVKIDEYKDRLPDKLSGGQQQRVALARAIVIHPDVLLMDEPLSNLDAKLRIEMRSAIREVQKNVGITTVYVTHDQEEALAMSDEIFVLSEGEIQQSGTPVDIYDEPINRFVADFIGESNIVPGVMIEDFKVEFAGKVFECVDQGMKPNEKIDIVIRPEDLEMTTIDKGKLVVKVDTQLFRGVHYELSTYDKDGNEWLVHSLKKAEVGTEIGLDFDPEAIHVMRLNETEEEFDKRLEAYGDDEDAN